MTRWIIFSLAALTVMSGPAHAVPSDRSVRIGQSIDFGRIRLRPLAIIEDSRCPANARCIWAGRLVVRTDVRTALDHRRVDLVFGDPARVSGLILTLNAATPARLTGRAIRPGAYRFGFAVTADR